MATEKIIPVSIKMPPEQSERVARLVKKSGITRHNLLLRIINLGLAQAEDDLTVLLSGKAHPGEDPEE